MEVIKDGETVGRIHEDYCKKFGGWIEIICY